MVCKHGDTNRKITGQVSLYKLPAIITTGENKENDSLSAKKTILPKQILP